MNSFERNALDNLDITINILNLTNKIAEYRGKQALYERQVPQVLDTLRQHAIIQSTESSNRIEGITVSSRRLDSIINDNSHPKDRSEAEVAGYRDVLRWIHDSYSYIPIRSNAILQLHRDLMAYVGSGHGGKWKAADNVIQEILPSGGKRIRFEPTPAWQTPAAMESLCLGFDVQRDFGNIPDVILIATFALDFLCIHPFPDGNGRMARLLTLLLLYQSEYTVGRYISLEKIVEETREQYYDTLYKSSQGWHDGKQDLIPWIEYFLTVILKAYHRFEERVGDVEHAQKRGWRQKRVRNVIQEFVADFAVSEVEERCPGISRVLITRTLNDMSKQGIIECIERGRNARWIKHST